MVWGPQATQKDVNDFLKSTGFTKVPYKRIWNKGYVMVTQDYGMRVYLDNHQIGAYLIFHDWNNWIDFKHSVEDLVD
jgi:hypothetical protein